MAKMIGLSRNIKLSWLKYTAELVSEGLTEKEIEEKLNDYLSYEIKSPTNVRKTRTILMNIWVHENVYLSKLKHEAVELMKKDRENAICVSWCMMLAAYPIFGDLCKLLGKMSEFQDEITLFQLKAKLFDEWGERTTLYHSIDKIIATLKAFGVLSSEKPGKYHIKKITVKNRQTRMFMAYAIMNITDSGYYSYQEINNSDYLFPFEYHVDKEELLEDKRFITSNFGGEISFSLN